MRFTKKGQSSTEYLIILAVVIVIALIVVGVLGGIPGIGKSGKQRASAIYWSTQDISVNSYSVNTDGYIKLNLMNNLRNSVIVTSVTVNGLAVGSGNLALGIGATNTREGDTSLTCTSGDTYEYTLSISYIDDATNSTYYFDGDGVKLVGVCASS